MKIVFLMSSQKIKNKHLELIADKTIKAVFPIFGMLTAYIDGKITGRIRNRFKTFVFLPTFPFMCFTFSASDVEKIDVTNSGIVLYLNKTEEKKKKRRKKKPALPVVEIEPEIPIDLNGPTNHYNGSYIAPDPIIMPAFVPPA